MSVARVTELSATSQTGFEDAINEAVARATKTLRGVEGAWVKDQNVLIEDGNIVGYKVNVEITFVLEEYHPTTPGGAGTIAWLLAASLGAWPTGFSQRVGASSLRSSGPSLCLAPMLKGVSYVCTWADVYIRQTRLSRSIHLSASSCTTTRCCGSSRGVQVLRSRPRGSRRAIYAGLSI
jgi:flavin-binding protein dodecin